MGKLTDIIFMMIFGISGGAVTSLAWFYPSLHLDKIMATLAGLIGIGFAVFQVFRLKSSACAEPVSIDVGDER